LKQQALPKSLYSLVHTKQETAKLKAATALNPIPVKLSHSNRKEKYWKSRHFRKNASGSFFQPVNY